MKNEIRKAEFIGSKIKQAREISKKTQAELAEFLGFDSSTAISLIEKGQRNITVENLEKIAEFLGQDVKFFIGDNFESIKVEHALRADADLDKDDKDAILRFIELAKKRHADRRK
jgi:transcriptional regulator with XRE-family HTH domain